MCDIQHGRRGQQMVVSSGYFTGNKLRVEHTTFYNLPDAMTLPSMSTNHSKADKTEFVYSSKTYANTLQILSHPTLTTLLPVGIVASYVMETAPPTQLESKTISLQLLTSTHMHKNTPQMKKTYLSPPVPPPLPSAAHDISNLSIWLYTDWFG
jgi:hypothetical protein